MRIVFVMLLLAGCAHAKPAMIKPKPAPAPAPIVEKVSDAELLHYKAAFLEFKAIETSIIEKYHIDAKAGEVFDPDTAVITRKPAPAPTTVPPFRVFKK